MIEHTTKATFVDVDRIAGEEAITATLSRTELEAALRGDESAQVWFELGREEDDETWRLALDVSSDDLEEMLRLASGDVLLTLDGAAVAGLFDEDPDVEAHGLRGALAVAVTAAAVAAPAGLAATPQTSSLAATTQGATAAATAQQAGAAATAQVASAAASAQVSKQVTGQVAKTQVAKTQVHRAQISSAQAAKAQVAKAQAGKRLAAFKLLRAGIR